MPDARHNIRELASDLLTPVGALLRLRAAGEHPFLLESAAGGERFGRYSILGVDPSGILSAHAPGRAEFNSGSGNRTGSLTDLLRGFVTNGTAVSSHLPFVGGLVGAIGFDFVREIERFDERGRSPRPLAWLGDYRHVVVFDHLRQLALLVGDADDATAAKRLDDLSRILHSALPKPRPGFRVGACRSNFSPSDFCEAVASLKRHIVAGDIFQGVLSQRFTRELDGDPFDLYRALRRVNPSPYMFYHETPVGVFIGASPELLVGVNRRTARLLPIAGTRPRGLDEAEDLRHEKSLTADPKERAEHMMLVDLARNDLGRVAEYGTVSVDESAAIHRFSHVMHMVSRVSAKLRPGLNAVDALLASFPAGTVSGAPKVRALELIFEHEPTPRDFYAGAAGFLDGDGNAEFCITLRTAIAHEGRLIYQAGAGIVADSVPQTEYEETIHKAGAIDRAIALATDS
ncbi:anthranilate synthase component I family protein [candidate division KSB1 bacterium]|nr:anthranilate synthase component I family protein [candidate division KSB1 bacterium]